MAIRPQQDGSATHMKASLVASRKGAGPRTQLGKQRSKYNALKHGLFARVVLLKHESQSQFDALLQGLEEHYMPVGILETIDVQKLATDYWRYRRLLQVETSEMQKNIDNLTADRSRRDLIARKTLEEHVAQTDRRGVLRDIEDYPEHLQEYVEKLCLVRANVLSYGLDRSSFATDLGFLYGARYCGRPGRDLFDLYIECLGALKATAEAREKKGFASETDCENRFVDATEKEISRLERLMKKYGAGHRSFREPKTNYNNVSLYIMFDNSVSDILLRYQTSLERSIDRTIDRLERLRRMRLGQPVLPKLEVHHSLS